MSDLRTQPAESAAPAPVTQYLTFTVAGEEYGVDILFVQEIKSFSATTPVPNTPPWVRGVMNLRGTIIPVVDLRARFGLPEGEYDRFTVVVVVKLGTQTAGLVVDAVSDVVSVHPAQIQNAPELGDNGGTRFVSSIVERDGTLLTILDVAAVLRRYDGPTAERERD